MTEPRQIAQRYNAVTPPGATIPPWFLIAKRPDVPERAAEIPQELILNVPTVSYTPDGDPEVSTATVRFDLASAAQFVQVLAHALNFASEAFPEDPEPEPAKPKPAPRKPAPKKPTFDAINATGRKNA